MSLSFSVSSGFIRPFLSIINGASKLGDFIFLIPNERSLEVISVHASHTAHLLTTIDAVHLDGYRYSRLVVNRAPHQQQLQDTSARAGEGEEGGDGQATDGESFVSASHGYAATATSVASSSASALVLGASNNERATEERDDGDGREGANAMLASATTQGSVDTTDKATRPVKREGSKGPATTAAAVLEEEDVTLRVPTSALQATLLHQNVSAIQSLQVRYISIEADAALSYGGPSSPSHGNNNNKSRLKPEMLCFDCMLTTGVVKSYQLHLVQGNPVRVSGTGLRDYHLELRGEPRLLGSLLAYLPSSSASCMLVPMDGQVELRWWSQDAEEATFGGGGDGTGGGGTTRGKRNRRRIGSGPGRPSLHHSHNQADALARSVAADGSGVDGSLGGGSVAAATVTAQRSHFTVFQYFDAQEEREREREGGADRDADGPQVVSATPYTPLPGKILEVKPFKLAAWLAGQLGQSLQILVGAAGVPVVFRTGIAAETFIVSDEGPSHAQNATKSSAAAAGGPATGGGGGGFRPVYQNVHEHAHGGGLFGNVGSGDAMVNVSFVMHVGTSDVEHADGSVPAEQPGRPSAGSAQTRPSTRPSQSAATRGSGGGGVEATMPGMLHTAGVAPSQPTPASQPPQPSRHEPLSTGGSSSSVTHYGGLSAATTLVMGRGTESSATPRSYAAPAAGDGSAGPSATTLVEGRRFGGQGQQHHAVDPFLTPNRASEVTVDATTQRSSLGDQMSHVSASPQAMARFSYQSEHASVNAAMTAPDNKESPATAISASAQSHAYVPTGPPLVMIGVTPRGSGGNSVVVSQQQQQIQPSLQATPSDQGPHPLSHDVHIVSPQHQEPQQQQQQAPLELSFPSAQATPAGTGRQRLSALYPLDYAAFATHAASSLRLSLTGGAAEGTEAPVEGTGYHMGGGSEVMHRGPNGPALPPAVSGAYEDAPGEGEEDEDGYDDGMEEVDEDLQRFLDSCSVMAMDAAKQSP